jgi:hypothetical protein
VRRNVIWLEKKKLRTGSSPGSNFALYPKYEKTTQEIAVKTNPR